MNLLGPPLDSFGRFFARACELLGGFASNALAEISGGDDDTLPDDPWLTDDL
jgi:hypothetical protein